MNRPFHLQTSPQKTPASAPDRSRKLQLARTVNGLPFADGLIECAGSEIGAPQFKRSRWQSVDALRAETSAVARARGLKPAATFEVDLF
jgi:hypothetical protein